MTHPVFHKCVSVRGGLASSFVFENEQAVQAWLKKEFLELKKEYGHLEAKTSDLPGLKVGDTCNVWGEAQDEFKIIDLIQYSPHRFGFILDSGCSEEVAKCHQDFIKKPRPKMR